MLQDEILRIGEYFRGIEYFNDAIIVKVVFPLKWQVYPSDNGFIKPAQNDNGEYYYYGDMNKVSLDDIFKLINETIDGNKNAEMKVRLLNDKVRELEDIFRKTEYDKLLTLKFTFEHPLKELKPKRKYTRRKKVEETTTVSSPTVEVDSEINQI